MDRLEVIPQMTTAGIVNYFHGMLSGTEHLHRVGVVHRDIKPDNFLLNGQAVKIGDFGMACTLPRRGPLTAQCGTGPYMSPEMLSGIGYREKTDMWSLGVTAYVLLYNTFPYMPANGMEISYEAMKQATLDEALSPRYERAGPDPARKFNWAVDFVSALLQRSPLRRLAAAQALEMPLFSTDYTPCDVVTGKMSSISCPDELGASSFANTQAYSICSLASTGISELDSQSQLSSTGSSSTSQQSCTPLRLSM